MRNWLRMVENALDECRQPVFIFFRDDDAGWANDRLYGMLDVFARHALPIDLAVIPDALDQPLADELIARRKQQPDLVGLHQHGFSHANHEPENQRKCEFGAQRDYFQQQTDLEQGKTIMDSMLGRHHDPIFTPPWNRCTQDTVAILENLGFEVLSRDISARAMRLKNLSQVPVAINWSKIIKTSAEPKADIAAQFTDSIRQNSVTGVMFHHADMAAEHLFVLSEFLEIVAAHPNACVRLIKQVHRNT